MAWKIQLPTGEFLDSVPDLGYEWTNQIFDGGDTSVLPGSFSFPADIVLNDRNKTLLGNPQLVTNAAAWKEFAGCWIHCYDHPLFLGNMKITNCNAKKATVTIIGNPMATLKSAYLSDMDLGGDRAIPSPIIDHMKDIAIAPSDYDYAFLPVRIINRLYEPGGQQLQFHNYYDQSADAFHVGSYAITPSVRVDYLLSRIITIEDTGYTFVNAFQTELELKRLYVYNNRDIRTSDTDADPDIPATFRLNDFLPKTKVVEALKSIIGVFGLGLFTNPFSRTIRLVSIASLLQRAPAHDWTKYAVDDWTLEDGFDTPTFYVFSNSPETPPVEWPRPEDAIFCETEEKFNAVYNNPSSVGKYFYIETNAVMYKITGYDGTVYGESKYCHRGVVLDDDYTKTYDTTYSPPFNSGNWGEVSRWIPDTNVPGKWLFDYHELTDFSLLIYRGIVNDNPTTSMSGWYWDNPPTRMPITENGIEVTDSQYSINMYGEYGIYAKFHRQWNEMRRHGKPVTQSFIVPVEVLTKFSFEDQVTVSGMDYFLKKITIKKTLGKGLLLISVSMVSKI